VRGELRAVREPCCARICAYRGGNTFAVTALHAAQVNGRCVWVWESRVRTYLALYSSWQYGAWFPVTEASAPSLYVALIPTSALLNSEQLYTFVRVSKLS